MITQSSSTYPWKAGIETILNFGIDAKQSQLRSVLYSKDDRDNTGMTTRFNISQGSKPFELMGPLHVDLFVQPKYLMSNVAIRIVLHRSSPSFYLHAPDDPNIDRAKASFAKIDTAILFTRRVQVSRAIEKAHEKALEKCNAIYPIQPTRIEVMPIPAGSQILVKENLFAGKIPRKLVIAIMTGGTLNGSFADAPFRFLSNNVRRIDITLDGEPVGDTPLSCDFEQNLHLRAYMNLFSANNKAYRDFGSDINMEDFKDLYSLFCFDLTSDSCGNTDAHTEIGRQGSLRITMGLQNVGQTLYALFYGEFEDTIEISKAREIITN
ncbi:MAG: hypothetical protein ACR2M9_01025 [Cyanophyceae cyanobacterium]